MFRDPDLERSAPVTAFLARVTHGWVAYGSEGVMLEHRLDAIAAAHGVQASAAVFADSAVLTVEEDGHTRTLTIGADQAIGRLDRFNNLHPVMVEAVNPAADLTVLGRKLDDIAASPPPYSELVKVFGIVLFTVGFAVNVQATWTEVIFSLINGLIAALVVVCGDRIQRITTILPFVAAFLISLVTVIAFNHFELRGGAILLMVPALFFFLPGDILSASMMDLAQNRVTIGATQFVHALFIILMLFLGVLMGAAVTESSATDLFAPAASAQFPAIVGWIGWAVFALGFTLALAVPLRLYGWIVLVVLVAFGVQTAITAIGGEVIGTYFAALAMFAVSVLISRKPGRPPVLVLELGGFFCLTVGSLGLEGLVGLLSGQGVAGVTDLVSMLTIAMAIALGILTAAAIFYRPLAKN